MRCHSVLIESCVNIGMEHQAMHMGNSTIRPVSTDFQPLQEIILSSSTSIFDTLNPEGQKSAGETMPLRYVSDEARLVSPLRGYLAHNIRVVFPLRDE